MCVLRVLSQAMKACPTYALVFIDTGFTKCILMCFTKYIIMWFTKGIILWSTKYDDYVVYKMYNVIIVYSVVYQV